jgi:hypothetical protein
MWRKRAALGFILVALVLFPACARAGASENAIVLYRIGEGGQEAWAVLRQRLTEAGFSFIVVQGETDIERHVEKVNRVNKPPWKAFLAIELLPGQKSGVLVARSNAKKDDGRFVPIERVPARSARESDRLATAVAAPFRAKVRHLPLFPCSASTCPE